MGIIAATLVLVYPLFAAMKELSLPGHSRLRALEGVQMPLWARNHARPRNRVSKYQVTKLGPAPISSI